MKIIILAGGFGTRISEETHSKPKPMVVIGEQPLLWHLMNIFGQQGFNDFVIALGYKGASIKEWLLNLHTLDGDIEVDVGTGTTTRKIEGSPSLWKVAAIETGLNTQTAGRIARCMKLYPGEKVLVTYGDGLGNINIAKLLKTHETSGTLATVTAVRPPPRFGYIHSDGLLVSDFGEKDSSDAGWINGGFFILEPQVLAYIENDSESFEATTLPKLVKDKQLAVNFHEDFWQPMDTLREKMQLENMAQELSPPWLLH